jgi:hypothetical protein
MNLNGKYLLYSLAFLLSLQFAFGAKRYWVGNGSNLNWNTTVNWSALSGGLPGASVPSSSDTAYFNGSGTGNCTLNVAANVKKLEMASGYTGTINLNAFGLTVGSGGFSIAAGTINLSSSTVTVSGNWTYTGGTITKGTSNVTFSLSSSLVVTVSGSHSLGKVTFSNSSVSASCTIASGTTLTVDTLVFTNADLTAINTGTINVQGNLRVQPTTQSGGQGTGTICLNGSSNQTITGVTTPGILCNVSINKSGGDVTVNNKIAVKSLSLLDGTANYKLLSGATSGYIRVPVGNVSMSSNCKANGGDATIHINGVGVSQTLSGSGVGKLPKVLIDVSASGGGGEFGEGGSGPDESGYFTRPVLVGGILTISGTVRVGNDWTYLQGSLTVTSSKVIYDPAYKLRIIGTHTLNKVAFNNSNGSSTQDSIIMRSGTTLTVADSLLFSGDGPIRIDSSGQINSSSHIKLTNTAAGGGGGSTLNINGTGSQTLTGSGSTSGLGLCNVLVNKSAGTLSLSSAICFASNLTYSVGTVSPGTSTLVFIGTGSTITFTPTVNAITFAPTAASTLTIASGTAMTATGTVTYAGNNALTVNTGTINAQAGVTITNTVTTGGGTAELNFNGTGTQTFTGVSSGYGLPLHNIRVSKSAGTLNLANTINTVANWTHSTGTVAPGTSKVVFSGTGQSVAGTFTLNAITISPPSTSATTVTLGMTNTVYASGTVTFEGSTAITLNRGTLNALADVTITNTVTAGGGTTTFSISGSNAATITGTSASTAAPFPHLTINKSGTLTITGTSLAARGVVTCTSGTYTTNTSNTFYLYGNAATNAPNLTFHHVSIEGTRTLSGNLSAAGNLSISSGATLDASGSSSITVKGNWVNAGAYKSGSGYVIFTGTNTQTITQPGGANDTIARLQVNKASGSLTLNSVVNISDTVKFTSGNITCDTTNILVFWRRSGVKDVSASSFVAGPVRKIGNSTFTFPIGKGSNYQPLALNTAPTAVTDAFQSEYFNTGQGLGSATDTTIGALSTCEYWRYTRKTGSSTVNIALGWNANSCNGDSASRMQLAWWNSGGSAWNKVAATAAGTVTSGTLTTTGPVTSFGYFTIAKKCVITSTLAASPSATVCTNASATLTNTASSNTTIPTYTWSPSTFLSATTGSVVTVSNPTATTTYTAIATNSWGCPAKRLLTITVISAPTLSVSPGAATICYGSSTTFTATGASTYTWAPGSVTTPTVSVSPTVTTTYTVTGTAANGCLDTETAVVTVNSLPTLTVTPASATICAGSSTSFTATGASTYTWTPGSVTGSTVSVSPGSTITYTVTGTDGNGCVNTATAPVTVNALPTITVTPSAVSVCIGSSATLTSSGAVTFTWSPASGLNTTTNDTVVATPTVTISYTATGTDANGCVNSGTATVTVNAYPSVTVNSDTICAGDTATLTASGASTYSWTPATALNTTTGATVLASPSVTLTYTVTGTSNGCATTATSTVLVVPTLTVTVNSDSVFITETATLTATGGTTYNWTPGTALNATTGATVYSTPGSTIVYTVTATTLGCTGVATSTVTVVPDTLPSLTTDPCACVSSFAPYPNKKYILSAWVRENNAAPTKTSFTYPEIFVDFGTSTGTFLTSMGPFKGAGNIIDGWQRVEAVFTPPANAGYLIIRLQSLSGDALFDDIRVFPNDGSMKSYVYDPETMRLVAELDERNYATLYEYDEDGKLTRVKKETEKGVMTIKESRNSSHKP